MMRYSTKDFSWSAMSAIITTWTHRCENTASKSCLMNIRRVMKGTGNSRLHVEDRGRYFMGVQKTAQF